VPYQIPGLPVFCCGAGVRVDAPPPWPRSIVERPLQGAGDRGPVMTWELVVGICDGKYSGYMRISWTYGIV